MDWLGLGYEVVKGMWIEVSDKSTTLPNLLLPFRIQSEVDTQRKWTRHRSKPTEPIGKHGLFAGRVDRRLANPEVASEVLTKDTSIRDNPNLLKVDRWRTQG